MLISLALSGCSDGDGKSGQSPFASSTETVEGVFIDSTVAGLSYRTETQSGMTDADGTFLYVEGETITFSIGRIVIGDTIAGSLLTPIDLVNGAENETDPAVTNICRLIQSLDSDCDPENGITITDRIRDELFDITVDFDQPPEEFGNSYEIGALFARLNAVGAFEDGRTGVLRSAEMARDHMRISLRDTWKKTKTEADNDGDGTIDVINYFTYDSMGRIIKKETDTDLDDISNRTQHTEYDSRGNLTKAYLDDNGDGFPENTDIFRYDDHDNLIRVESDLDGDGATDYLSIRTYDSRHHLIGVKRDDNADGRVDSTKKYTRDTTGNLLKIERDNDADGHVDYAVMYSYDAEGNRTEVVKDAGADETEDAVTTFQYENGKLTVESRDNDGDGKIDFSIHSSYDPAGHLILEDWDQNGDGVAELSYTYLYDATGRHIKTCRKDLTSGITDTLLIREPAGNGYRITISLVHSGNELPNPVFIMLFDNHDNLIRIQLDSEGDGEIDDIETHHWAQWVSKGFNTHDWSIPPRTVIDESHTGTTIKLSPFESPFN